VRLLLCVLALVAVLTGCDGVRHIKSPGNDISVIIERKVGPLPDDCEVRQVKDCKIAPPSPPSGSSLLESPSGILRK